MAHLLKCPLDTRHFRTIKNLSMHMRKMHPQSVSQRIRNGQAQSTHMPSKRAEILGKCVAEIAGLVATVTPAIVTRDPSFAPAIIASIGRSVEECRPLFTQ